MVHWTHNGYTWHYHSHFATPQTVSVFLTFTALMELVAPNRQPIALVHLSCTLIILRVTWTRALPPTGRRPRVPRERKRRTRLRKNGHRRRGRPWARSGRGRLRRQRATSWSSTPSRSPLATALRIELLQPGGAAGTTHPRPPTTREATPGRVGRRQVGAAAREKGCLARVSTFCSTLVARSRAWQDQKHPKHPISDGISNRTEKQ